MPVDDIYWNPTDFGSDESLPDPTPPTTSKHYVDPWDLENYAYIREQLDLDDSSDPTTSGEFLEANSTSFYYVPGDARRPLDGRRQAGVPQGSQRGGKFDSLLTEQGNYAAIDEVKVYDRKRPSSDLTYEVNAHRRHLKRMDDFDMELEESPYEDNSKDDGSLYVYGGRDKNRNHIVPHAKRNVRDRSLSFSYGDTSNSGNTYRIKYQASPRIPESVETDSSSPLYDDIRSLRSKPSNFGLSNYGHLKIDYSYSWNNLYKIIGS